MGNDGFRFNTDAFDTALQRRIATSTRDHFSLMVEQARGIMRRVIAITPPGSDGVKAGSRQATEQGKAKTASDIYKLYGTPSDAFDLIKKEKGEGVADAFWKLSKEPGKASETNQFFREQTGKSFTTFDDGAIHKRLRARNGRVNRSKIIYFVSNPEAVSDYVAKKQGNVNWLVAGWKRTALKLGVSLPSSISRHDSPGEVILEATAERLRMVATNAVSFASNVRDIERRLQWAMNKQTDAMNRAWDDYQDKLNKAAGL